MPLYKCKYCNYSTSQKSNYKRHLNTQKHDYDSPTIRSIKSKNSKTDDFLPFFTTKTSKNGPFSPIPNTHFTIFDPFLPQITTNLESDNLGKKSICLYCHKEFSSIYHAKRHMKNNCKVKQYYEALEEKNEIEKKKQEIAEQQNQIRLEELHQKQISMLLQKVGNTTINNHCLTTNNTQNNTQNNTVQLNNFGNEDLTMLTEKYMRKMVIYPYSAIPKMIKKIHFNDKYPANQNIRMLNKKDNKIQIRNNDKWEFVDKKATLEQLINEKNYQLDTYYENNKDTFEGKHQDRFDSFQDKINDEDRNVMKSMNTGSELIFWNSM